MANEDRKLDNRRDNPDTNWLVPFKTPNSNAVLKGPSEGIGDLDCELTEDPEFHSVITDSAWGLDDEQRARIGAGAHIRLGVWQHPIPPLSVEIEPPYCESCGAPKVYVTAESAYFCAGACPERDPRFGPSPVMEIEEKSALDQAHADFTPDGDSGE